MQISTKDRGKTRISLKGKKTRDFRQKTAENLQISQLITQKTRISSKGHRKTQISTKDYKKIHISSKKTEKKTRNSTKNCKKKMRNFVNGPQIKNREFRQKIAKKSQTSSTNRGENPIFVKWSRSKCDIHIMTAEKARILTKSCKKKGNFIKKSRSVMITFTSLSNGYTHVYSINFVPWLPTSRDFPLLCWLCLHAQKCH